MGSLSELLRRIFYLLRRQKHADDLADELELHLDLRTRRNEEQGMSPETARREAIRSFGSPGRVRDEASEVWIARWADQFGQDLKFGFRWLRRSPAFTVVVVLTLATGIGVNTAMFSLVNAALLQPLPYPQPQRLVWIAGAAPTCSPDCFNSRADFKVWSQQAASFEAMAGFGNLDLALVHRGHATAERIAFVTDGFWNMTGARVRVGRLPYDGEADALVLSWGLFEREFGGNRDAIGRKVAIEGHQFEIVGVLGPEFRFLFPQELHTGDELKDIDAYSRVPEGAETPGDPMKPNPALGPGPTWLRAFARLNTTATLEQAKAELALIHDQLSRQYPSPFRTKTLSVVPLAERVVGDARLALIVLLGAVGFVLIIACANVANLLLARTSNRRKEIAIRAALGAGQARMVRQFVTESLLLAFFGGTAGLALAGFFIQVLVRYGGQAVPRLAETTIDSRVLLFTMFVTVLTGILFGLAPARTLWRGNLDAILREDAKATSSSSRQQQFRFALVSLEVALSVVLLSGAGLLLRSFWSMNTFPAGFAPDRVLVMKLSLSGGRYARNWAMQDAYIREVIEKLQQVKGVEAVGIECGTVNQPVEIDGTLRDAPLVVALRAVSPGYFRALGVSITHGQWPGPGEDLDAILVNQSLAWKARGADQDIVGRRISGGSIRGTVAGVVADFKDRQLDSQPAPQAFISYRKSPTIGAVRVLIRTEGNPAPILPTIRSLVFEIDKDVPIQQFQTLESSLSDSIAPRRFNMFLLAGFATTALLLALVGIYGVIAYIVTQRTREIGIRMALGAERRHIVGMIALQGMRMTVVGLVLGLASALLLTRLMASMIYALSATDPITYFAVILLIALAAFLACYGPAYRASVLDPLVALRRE